MDFLQGSIDAGTNGNLALTMTARAKAQPVVHHAALPWAEAPAFLRLLDARERAGALALRFTILTAARSGEVRGARWAEVDLEQAVWTVPAARMKARREHRVPLTAPALAILRGLLPLATGPDSLVFPGLKPGRPLSDMSLTAVLHRLGRGDLTTHGFRSTFRDWAAETGQPADVAEAALAHVLESKVQAAYQRGDLLDRRRILMTAWANYLTKS